MGEEGQDSRGFWDRFFRRREPVLPQATPPSNVASGSEDSSVILDQVFSPDRAGVIRRAREQQTGKPSGVSSKGVDGFGASTVVADRVALRRQGRRGSA